MPGIVGVGADPPIRGLPEPGQRGERSPRWRSAEPEVPLAPDRGRDVLPLEHHGRRRHLPSPGMESSCGRQGRPHAGDRHCIDAEPRGEQPALTVDGQRRSIWRRRITIGEGDPGGVERFDLQRGWGRHQVRRDVETGFRIKFAGVARAVSASFVSFIWKGRERFVLNVMQRDGAGSG